MNAGNLIFLLVVVGGAVAMFSMHRGGGHSHGTRGSGGHVHGSSGHGSSNSQGTADTTEQPREEGKPLLGKPGTGEPESEREPAADEHRHRHC